MVRLRALLLFGLTANAARILDIVRDDPQLATLAKLLAGTGAGLPNPGM
jgi:hypothetical protein